MKTIAAAALLVIALPATAAPPDLDRPLSDDLRIAIRQLESVQDRLEPDDYFAVSGFVIRALWCEQAGRRIHRGLSIRQALDLDTEREHNGGDLFGKADPGNAADVVRVCGMPRQGT